MVGIELSSKVGQKGQVVIPKPIRELLKISSSSDLVFAVEGEKVVLRKKNSSEQQLEALFSAMHKKKFPAKTNWSKYYKSHLGEKW